jgi:hypothetical protein
LLQDLKFLGRQLSVYVVSTGGWSWALAWAQLGVAVIYCLPRNDVASKELALLRRVEALDARLVEVRLGASLNPELDQGAVVRGHLVWERLEKRALDREQVLWAAIMAQRRHVWLLTAPTKSLGAGFIHHHCTPYVVDLRHGKLGGLTQARITVGWAGPKGVVGSLYPSLQKNPKRPLDKFLEPSVRLLRWRAVGTAEQCWRPSAEGASPYPWPWPDKPMWVEAPSVYFGGKAVERPMTAKEMCQLVDLREDWGATLVEAMWGWDSGAAPPLRLLVEFGLAARSWLQQLVGEKVTEGEEDSCVKEFLDWGRVRAPWLGIGEAPHFDRMQFYGWDWGKADAVEGAVACRADDAQVDLALWAIGGEGERLEKARGAIRDFLHGCWRRGVCRDACRWLKTAAAAADLERNTHAARDCVKRCANSTWWEWSDGSRLLFWRWAEQWRVEARDGAMGHHTGTPEPQLHYPSVPMAAGNYCGEVTSFVGRVGTQCRGSRWRKGATTFVWCGI